MRQPRRPWLSSADSGMAMSVQAATHTQATQISAQARARTLFARDGLPQRRHGGQFVQGLGRGKQILEALARADDGA